MLHRSWRHVLVLIATLALALAVGGVATPATPTDQASRTDRLERVLAGVMRAGAPGAVLELRTDQGGTAIARGVADLDTGRLADPGDRYRIGSVTKSMVAVAVLQLAAQGQLALDDRVVRWLPGLGLDPRLTVRHLLQQTSGFRTNTMVFAPPRTIEGNRFRTFLPRELVRLAQTNPRPPHRPGTTFEYSNTNYVLAGLLIKRVTHLPVEWVLEHRIFEPVGMDDTSFERVNPLVVGRHLHGYVPQALLESTRPVEPDGLSDLTVYSPSWAFTAGGVVSTVTDTARFLRALFSGRLLPDRWLDRMMSTGRFGYGLGLYPLPVSCVPGGHVWGHDGIVFGYTGMAFSTPNGKRQVVVAGNLSFDNHDRTLRAIATAVGRALCGTATQAGGASGGTTGHP